MCVVIKFKYICSPIAVISLILSIFTKLINSRRKDATVNFILCFKKREIFCISAHLGTSVFCINCFSHRTFAADALNLKCINSRGGLIELFLVPDSAPRLV